jgi:hypothetical protein
MSFKIIELFNNTIKVFETGQVLVKRFNNDEFYEKKCSKSRGYLRLPLYYKGKEKSYKVHRLVAFAFLNLDLENKKQIIDHKDRNQLNNDVSNLRILSQQQNTFNTNAKGYSWHKRDKKWVAQISINGKSIYLGCFETEEDARQAYLDAKLIYHII